MKENIENMQHKIIFTDCFNTLLGRTCLPNDMLFKWASEMNKKYPQISSEFFFGFNKGVNYA